MEKQYNFLKILLWIARIWGSLSLLFLVFMVGAHAIEALFGSNDAAGFQSVHEIISFVFFPISTMIGLSMAMKWEGLGGLITILGMIGFHIATPDLLFDPLINGLFAPGILYIFYWFLSRESR